MYKCIVHFDDEINKVGHITNDGDIIPDQIKNKYWAEQNKDQISVKNVLLNCRV